MLLGVGGVFGVVGFMVLYSLYCVGFVVMFGVDFVMYGFG